MAALFEPYKLKDVTLRNRIAIPPMCQYMANDGIVNDWHHVHLASMARGGAGLLVVEATAVSPEGRITPGCAGIWSDAHAQAFVPMVKAIKAAGAVPGIQIAHAGRKASANRPWEGDDHIPASDARSWETIAPSAIAFGANLPNVPRAMTLDDIARVRQDFVDAARRARDAGFEWIELHFAHGYLGQSFFSEHSNQRTETKSTCPACNAPSANCGVPNPQAEVTGMPASRRTRSAIGPRNAGPHGIWVSAMVKPTLTLSRSRPPTLKRRASSMDSVSVCSSRPSYSITPKRAVNGRFSGQTSRTAARVSRRKRLRLSKLPP